RATRLEAAFAAEVERGLRLAARVRLLAIAVIGVWVVIENPWPEFLYQLPALGLFALFGFLPLLARRDGRPIAWVRYLCPLLDVALLTVLVMLPNPLETDVVPPQIRLRFGNDIYLFVFIIASAFTYSPLLVLWTGFCAALVWSVATLAIVLLPDSVTYMPVHASPEDLLARVTDPHRVYLNVWGRQVLVLLVCAGALAVLVERAR